MNTKKQTVRRNFSICFVITIFLVCFVSPRGCDAQSTDKFYYWVDGSIFNDGFVVEVDANMKAQIDAAHSQGGPVHFRAHIASGSVPYDKNYCSPTHAVWNWHVVSVDALGIFYSPLDFYDPAKDDGASKIAQDPAAWIQKYGDEIHLEWYTIGQQIDPTLKDAMANVSNRGMTGAGERALITGFIITGGEPRNVVIRALGPSLSALGIQQPVANPKIEVYQGSHIVETNLDWKKGSRASDLSQNYPSLAPTNDKEAALLLTLLPGTYTIQVSSEDGVDGVAVVEAYDVDYNLN
jgi:hypothetical protein